MSVVARSGQALGGNRALLRTSCGLKCVKEAEANRQLQLRVAVDLDVRAIPEVIKVRALVAREPLPTGVSRTRQRRCDLVEDRRSGALAGPSVGEELDETQGLSGHEVRRHEQTRKVLKAFPVAVVPGGPLMS
jgi:hypothetical protein